MLSLLNPTSGACPFCKVEYVNIEYGRLITCSCGVKINVLDEPHIGYVTKNYIIIVNSNNIIVSTANNVILPLMKLPFIPYTDTQESYLKLLLSKIDKLLVFT